MKSGSKLLTSSRDFCQKETRVSFEAHEASSSSVGPRRGGQTGAAALGAAVVPVRTVRTKQRVIVNLPVYRYGHSGTPASPTPRTSC